MTNSNVVGGICTSYTKRSRAPYIGMYSTNHVGGKCLHRDKSVLKRCYNLIRTSFEQARARQVQLCAIPL
jgi:hypothetical protein